MKPTLHLPVLAGIMFVLAVGTAVAVGQQPSAGSGRQPRREVEDYNQWKESLDAGQAVDPATIERPGGFQIELLRSARPAEGSWVSMAFDPQGRLVIAREDRGLLRLSLPCSKPHDPPAKENRPIRVETINDTLLECRGLLFAFDSLYANANNSKGLYRLRDTNGDDQYDEVALLKQTSGGVGHGRNDLTLGPDDRIYLIHGNDVRLPDGFRPGRSPLRHYAEDRLLSCAWDQHLFNAGVRPPAGHVIRTDRDGSSWELVAGGFRNPFGIAFNRDGEMFTYDADMEWDVGAPWYRPTRVNHILSGGDYGWRQGTGKWPSYYPDSLPAILDIGLGSPTAVQFGYQSDFPPPYREALYILDWAYGRILAVHMTPQGASYTCQLETFLKGRPLNVTDLDFGPDAAMYFITGGRGTQSGLYRVRYAGPRVVPPEITQRQREIRARATAARALRRRLESFHGSSDPAAVAAAWPHLSQSDIWIRHAARIAVEHQDVQQWLPRVVEEDRATAAATALLALARAGRKEHQVVLFRKLQEFRWNELTAEQRLIALRAATVSCCRHGKPDPLVCSQIRQLLEQSYGDDSPQVNQMLCDLLVYLESPVVVSKTLDLLARAKTQEEKLHYLYALRLVKAPWTLEQRKTYFLWLRQANRFFGARYMPRFIDYIKQDAVAMLTDQQQRALQPLLAPLEPSGDAALPAAPRKFVRNWEMDDLIGSLASLGDRRDLQRGQSLFKSSLCVKCHKLGPDGTPVGPDLSNVASRLGRTDLLKAMLSPSEVVAEKYRNVAIVTKDGKVIVGQVIGGDQEHLTVATNPLDPQQITHVEIRQIESKIPSLVSPMPEGLLNTLSKEEILDLLAYIEVGGPAPNPATAP